MTRTPLLALLLAAGCAAPPPQRPSAPAEPAPEPKIRACQAAPAKLPPVRSIEALKRRHDALDLLYADCAERLRLAVEAYDALRARPVSARPKALQQR